MSVLVFFSVLKPGDLTELKVPVLLRIAQPAQQNPGYVEMHPLHWRILHGFKTWLKAKNNGNASHKKRSQTFSSVSEGTCYSQIGVLTLRLNRKDAAFGKFK